MRQLFESYLANRALIRRLKADKCYATDTVTGSSDEAPYTSHAITISGVDGVKLRANRAKIERLEADCAYVEAAVAMAPNSQVRVILELRYLDGLHWPEVAARLTDDRIDLSEAAAKQKAYRYLAALEEQEKAHKAKKGKPA